MLHWGLQGPEHRLKQLRCVRNRLQFCESRGLLYTAFSLRLVLHEHQHSRNHVANHSLYSWFSSEDETRGRHDDLRVLRSRPVLGRQYLRPRDQQFGQ